MYDNARQPKTGSILLKTVATLSGGAAHKRRARCLGFPLRAILTTHTGKNEGMNAYGSAKTSIALSASVLTITVVHSRALDGTSAGSWITLHPDQGSVHTSGSPANRAASKNTDRLCSFSFKASARRLTVSGHGFASPRSCLLIACP